MGDIWPSLGGKVEEREGAGAGYLLDIGLDAYLSYISSIVLFNKMEGKKLKFWTFTEKFRSYMKRNWEVLYINIREVLIYISHQKKSGLKSINGVL